MRFLSTILLFAGYALVYASVANHGRMAKDPWMGLFADAYTDSLYSPTAAGTTAQQQTSTGTTGVI